jgi:hypothetical protein
MGAGGNAVPASKGAAGGGRQVRNKLAGAGWMRWVNASYVVTGGGRGVGRAIVGRLVGGRRRHCDRKGRGRDGLSP